MLSGTKTETIKPIKQNIRKTPNTKYSQDSGDLQFWV